MVASAFARDVMAFRIAGDLTVALALGLSQLASTFVIAWRYARYSREVLDPLAARIVADADRRIRTAVRRSAEGTR